MAKEQFSKKDLEAVATDLNKIFEQPIPTGRKATITSLKKDLIEAAQEIRANDVISDKSKEILTVLGAKLPFEEEEEKEKKKEEKEEKSGKPAVKKANDKKVTKKSIIITILRSKSGGTIEDMAEACVKANLGDLARNMKTCKLWLRKIGFAITKEKNVFKAK